MRNELSREALGGREVLTGDAAVASADHDPGAEFLMPTSAFLKVMNSVYGFKVSRRTLQLYSSPQLQLLPRPLHIGGHISFYAHPEHTERLAVILHLAMRQFMPLKAIRKLLRVYPPRHYRLLLHDVLTPKELTDLQDFFDRGMEIKDLLFRKVCRILLALDTGFDPRMHRQEAIDKELFAMVRQLEKWIDSSHRKDMEGWIFLAENQ